MFEIDRRAFLTGIGTAMAVPMNSSIAQADLRDAPFFAAAYMTRDRSYGLAFLNESGEIQIRFPLPARGHGMATHAATGQCVIFARRPGGFAIRFHREHRHKPQAFACPPDRHFFGHGVFSIDGNLLYATENNFEDNYGVIGVYDMSGDGRRIGEFNTHGIGPHDLALLPDQPMLWVANGGIETHPDFGRTKLNIETMRSNIVLLDLRTGDLVEKYETPAAFQRLSLRHMAADGFGNLWAGGQFEGNANEPVPLVAFLNRDQGLKMAELPEDLTRSLRSYIGSIGTNHDGTQIAFSSPKGSKLVILDAARKRVVSQRSIDGVCGLSSSENGFLVSTQNGEFARRRHNLFWDNHIGMQV